MGRNDENQSGDNAFDPFDFLAKRADSPRVLRNIPLFPLNTVLFPEMALPLHIFEPRYRLMIDECMRENAPFGVVLIQEGAEAFEQAEPYKVGTLARITEVARLDDGRFLLNTIGTQRFKLLRVGNDKPYMTGDVEIWPDGELHTYGEDLTDLMIGARRAFEAYLDVLMALARKQIEGLTIPDDAATLSYLVPNWLRIDLEEKQRLLEMDAPDTRLRAEIEALQQQTEFFQNVKRRTDETGGIDPTVLAEEFGIEIEEEEEEDAPSSDVQSFDLGDHFSRN